MTYETISDCISLIKLNWSNYLKDATTNELQAQKRLWAIQFASFSDEEVYQAIQRLISTCKYYPSIAEIKEEIAKMKMPSRTDEEVWNYIHKAIKNSTYHSISEWEKLPEDIKVTIMPERLREMAQTTDGLQFIKKDVIREYRDYHSKGKEALMIGDVITKFKEIELNK